MDLRSKYGAGAFEAGAALQPKSFERRVEQRDAIDQHFTRLWLDFAIKGLGRRPALDTRTRLLVLIGQYTMARSHGALEDSIHAALAAGVPIRDVAEIVLQCIVYGGHTVVDPAIEVAVDPATAAGVALRTEVMATAGEEQTHHERAAHHQAPQLTGTPHPLLVWTPTPSTVQGVGVHWQLP